MNFNIYAHRFADIILNADYEIKQEIEDVVRSIKYAEVENRYANNNLELKKIGKKGARETIDG